MDSGIVEVVIRSFGAYTILMVINNMLGKQTLSQMTNHDFITAVMMGAIGANLAFDTQVSYWHSFIALLIIGGIGYSTTYLSLKNRGVRKWFSGEPSMFIENGKILESNMKKQKFNMDSLNQSLREKNIFDINEVDYAVLEPDGHLSVMRKNDNSSLFPVELIMDGKVIENNLRDIKLSKEWLEREVRKRGYEIKDVFYCVRGPDGSFAFDYHDDRLRSPIDRER